MPGLGIHPRSIPVAGTGRGSANAMPMTGSIPLGEALRLEHEWWVRRHQAAARAAASGELGAGVSYAVASREAQIVYSRGTWWGGATFTLFAWLAIVRTAAFDWGDTLLAYQTPPSNVLLESALILLVGVAAAIAVSAWIGGSDSWRSTLVGAPFWALAAVALGVVVVSTGIAGLAALTVVALGCVALMLLMPLRT